MSDASSPSVVPLNSKCHCPGPTSLSRGQRDTLAKVHETRTSLAGGLAAPPLPPQPAQPSTRASSSELLRLERRGRRARGWRGASELSGSEELLRALCACVVQAIVVIGQPRRASWCSSARARGPGREGGDLGHARGARGRPVARLRVGQPVRPSLSRYPGRLRAKPARSATQRTPHGPPGLARGENCGPRCSITVAPSRWRLPAQAVSAKSEAQRGGHGGWPTAWPTQGGAACRAAWLGKHLGSLEAPRSGIAPTRLGRSKTRVGCFAGPSGVF